MGFAREVSREEAALGFEIVEHPEHGLVVVAPVGVGLRAVKIIDSGRVGYAICDERLVALYEHAPSLFDLRFRFALGDREVG